MRIEGHTVDHIVMSVDRQLAAVLLVPDVGPVVLTAGADQGVTGVQVDVECSQ